MQKSNLQEYLKSLQLKKQEVVGDTTAAPNTNNTPKNITQPNSNLNSIISNRISAVDKDKFTNFVLDILKIGVDTFNSIPAPGLDWCYETEKFRLYIPTKCGSRSFSRYFSILNIGKTYPLPKKKTKDYFSKKNNVIVLRDPVDKFYSGLITSFTICANLETFEREEDSFPEIIVRHTLAYTNIAASIEQLEIQGNLYHIPFHKVNLYANEIRSDFGNVDISSNLHFLKLIISPEDVYGKETWKKEINSYRYLLENSQEYSLTDWKQFKVKYY